MSKTTGAGPHVVGSPEAPVDPAAAEQAPPRWVAPVFILLGVGLVPWTVVLAFTLPARHGTHHYDVAWTGFDVVLVHPLADQANLLKRLGIRHRPPYNTRHTYATMMLMAGMTPAFCAGQMGHSVEVFLRTYAKWIPGAGDKAEMAKLERQMKGTGT